MPAISGFVNFNPDKDIPSLQGRVIFVTGGMLLPSLVLLQKSVLANYSKVLLVLGELQLEPLQNMTLPIFTSPAAMNKPAKRSLRR